MKLKHSSSFPAETFNSRAILVELRRLGLRRTLTLGDTRKCAYSISGLAASGSRNRSQEILARAKDQSIALLSNFTKSSLATSPSRRSSRTKCAPTNGFRFASTRLSWTVGPAHTPSFRGSGRAAREVRGSPVQGGRACVSKCGCVPHRFESWTLTWVRQLERYTAYSTRSYEHERKSEPIQDIFRDRNIDVIWIDVGHGFAQVKQKIK
eukprot:408438_1